MLRILRAGIVAGRFIGFSGWIVQTENRLTRIETILAEKYHRP